MNTIIKFFKTTNIEIVSVTSNSVIARVGYVEFKVTEKKGKYYLNIFALNPDTCRICSSVESASFSTEEQCIGAIKQHQYEYMAKAMYEACYELQKVHNKEIDEMQAYIDYLY